MCDCLFYPVKCQELSILITSLITNNEIATSTQLGRRKTQSNSLMMPTLHDCSHKTQGFSPRPLDCTWCSCQVGGPSKASAINDSVLQSLSLEGHSRTCHSRQNIPVAPSQIITFTPSSAGPIIFIGPKFLENWLHFLLCFMPGCVFHMTRIYTEIRVLTLSEPCK